MSAATAHVSVGSLAALLKRICDGKVNPQLLWDAPHPAELKAVATSTALLHADPAQRLTLPSLLAMPIFAAQLDELQQRAAGANRCQG